MHEEISYWATYPIQSFIQFSSGMDLGSWIRFFFRIGQFVSYAATI
jgi:hypothetical protein